MSFRPVALLAPVLGIALAFVAPFDRAMPGIKKKKRGAPAAAVGGVWSDAEFLKKHVGEAATFVHQSTGTDFLARPEARASDVATVALFLREDMDAAFRTLGAKSNQDVVAMAHGLAGQLVAAYDPKENVIHVVPANAVKAAEAAGNQGLLSGEILQLVLVRMAVIAVDRQLFPEWKEALDSAKTLDAVHVAGAVLEGHAQYITKRVADHWVNTENFPEEAFDDLVTLLTTGPADDAPGGAAALEAEAKFAIIKGHDFMAFARHRVARVLRAPPTDRKAILDPAAYFKPRPKADLLPEQISRDFGPLMLEGDGWTVETADCPATEAESWVRAEEKRFWAGVVASFRKGRIWRAGHSESEARTTIYLLEFEKGGMAEGFVNIAKGAAKKSGGEIEEGAGRDNGLPGFSAKRTLKDDAGERIEHVQLTSEGRFVLGFRTTHALTDREPWDDAMESSAEALGKAQKTRRNRRDK